jgi:hypothetical protein
MTSSRTVIFSKEIFMEFFIYLFIFSSSSSTVIRLIDFDQVHRRYSLSLSILTPTVITVNCILLL